MLIGGETNLWVAKFEDSLTLLLLDYLRSTFPATTSDPLDFPKTMKSISTILFILGVTATGLAEEFALRLSDLLEPLPQLDGSIATPEAGIGIPIGSRHLYCHEINAYLDSLSAASPRMKALGAHAVSHGGRPVVSYAISSSGNIARLDEIIAARESIIDPDAQVDLENQPAVMFMGYSVHGDESSAANAVPLVAYYLAAAQSEKLASQLEEMVLILNPVLNPDGLDRFAHWTNSHRGAVPSADPSDREHVQRFPSGRTNYYWFDLNRDWLPHQHPESQGRLDLFHQWKPNVQLDFHEQHSSSSYFFMPGKPERTNPLTPAINQRLTNEIAHFHREVFDAEGTLYVSEEGYDDFFMGKGSTYPDLFGCVGILFEQPSSRGIRQDTQNGLLDFPTTIANQFKTTLSSIEALGSLKGELLEYQRGFYRDAAKESAKRSGHYLASAYGDAARLREFARVLQGHCIKVELLAEDYEMDGVRYAAGETLAIEAGQRQSTFMKSLWSRQVEFEENVFYDVSTWTLPLAFNMRHSQDPVKKVNVASLDAAFWGTASGPGLAESSIGYLIDWRDSDAPALLYALLKEGANARVATRPLTAQIVGGEERAFGYGTILVAKALNDGIPEGAIAKLEEAASRGVPVYPVASSYTHEGIDLGSRYFKVIELPKLLLVSGPGMSPYNVGEIWHLLDQRLRMPVTMVDSNRLSGVDLRDYTHILLTSGLSSLVDSGVDGLKNFVQSGGVIWGQGDGAVKWLVDKELATVEWRQTEEEKAKEAEKKADDSNADSVDSVARPKRLPFVQAQDQSAFKLVRGAIFGASLDVSHPIGYGYESEFLPVFRRSSKFIEPSSNPYSTPVLYRKDPLLSGYISEENLELLSGSASLVIEGKGDGAIALAMDYATFRAFWWGTQRLLVNAIFFGDLLESPN